MRFGITELLILLAIIMLIFGTKKIRNIGGDLGGVLRDFRKAIEKEDTEQPQDNIAKNTEAQAKDSEHS